MKRAVVLSLAAVSAVFACQSDQTTAPNPPTRHPAISTALVDGSHGGNAHFFFLPPMVPPLQEDQPPPFSGTFDPSLQPVVQICTIGDNGACPPVASFTTPPPGTPFNPLKVTSSVQVVPNGQFYFVVWRPDWRTLDPTRIQRISVSVGAQSLGIADVKVVASLTGFRAVWASNEFVPLPSGWPLLIIFRIEQGAVGGSLPPACSGQPDCIQVTLGPNPTQTRDVVTPTGRAAASFPPGYFAQTVTLTIHQVPEGCFSASTPGTRYLDFGCYSFVTSPQVGNPLGCNAETASAATCARVEVCPTLTPTNPNYQHLDLYRSDPEQPAVRVERDVKATLVTCLPPIGLRAHGAADLARATWRSVMNTFSQLVTPKSLFAATAMINLGGGGLTCCFSNIGWALPVSLSTVPSTNRNTAAPGTLLVPNPAVLAQYLHPVPSPAPGLNVNFAVLAGGGTVGAPSATTGIDGIAQVPWTLGAGVNRLVATLNAANGSPDTIYAKGQVALIDCPPTPGGDLLDRGFYVPGYQGLTVNRVDLYFAARTAGTYTISLTAHSGAYDGPVIGNATASVALTANDVSNVQTTFNFPANVVTLGSTVAFAVSQISGPSTEIFLAVGSCGLNDPNCPTTCPVIETESATTTGGPLDTFRRKGLSVRIFGDLPT